MKKNSLLIIALFLMPINTIAAPNKITFPNACATGKHLVIAAVGDVLLHQPLQMQAEKKGFHDLFAAAAPYLQQADIAFANLEGPVAPGVSKYGKLVQDPGQRFDHQVYTSFPLFNYPENLIRDLQAAGIDIVSTANNHTLDRFSVGIDKTINILNKHQIQFIGTRPRGVEPNWAKIMTRHGIKVAWIACAAHTNGITDQYHQVLHCYTRHDRPLLFNLIRALKNKVDAIIVVPHWGQQYSQTMNAQQIRFAKQWLDAGALMVMGSHPHCLQPMQQYHTKDGRDTLIVYSLGNFISYQGTPKNRASMILLVGLTKNSKGTFINGMRYIPTYMQNRSGFNKIRLTLIAPKQKKSIGYQIVTQVLPASNLLFPPTHLPKVVGCGSE